MDLTGIVIIVGNYGSGKTETAVNLAASGRKAGKEVRIADLDLVNPYFRAREAKKPLEDLGIDVVLPDAKYMHADLPILAPAVAGLIRQPAELSILDAGGDDVGVTVLAALADELANRPIHMLQVINPLRPFTGTVEGCIKIKEEIEASAKRNVTGFVSNANLLDETRPEHIYDGYELVKETARAAGLHVQFITASSRLLPQLDRGRIDSPILTIDRKLLPPWKSI